MVVLANLAQIAGIYFWALIDGIVGNARGRTPGDVPLVTATGVAFIAAMTLGQLARSGDRRADREHPARHPVSRSGHLLVVDPLRHFFAGTAPDPTPFDWSWFNPFAFTEWAGFIESILLALFIYWGLGYTGKTWMT